ncbi:hypothetical protein [Buchananella hordeovulneris]|uniref:hypothetical protein n=1 Tax=Buchananella hordeovulneris TaxID=52770 RepID=UPI000F5F9A40|nr:hypothetical protein [Buchananella hordeovulneris]RRD45493.1 hypothetical protein EII13_01120 [Buchananella hordeovulneris]
MPTLHTFHSAVRVLAATSRGRALLVAVGGPSGAGKSTLAAALATLPAAGIFPLETCYRGWRGLHLGLHLAADHLAALRAGQGAVAWPQWDWAAARPLPPRPLPRPLLLIVEGVGADHPLIAAHADVVVRVEAGAAVRQQRVAARDGRWDFAWHEWARLEASLPRVRPHLLVQAGAAS